MEQRGLVGGEILIEREAGIERDDGDQVGGLHLFVDVILRGVDGAVDVLRLHRGEVEEEDDQPVIAELLVGGDDVLRGRLRRRASGHAADGGFVERSGLIDAFEVEGGDLLRLAVFEDGEVALLETADDFAGLLVADDDVGEDEVAVDLQGE